MSPTSCAHPEAQRTRLSSGRGYRCEVCRTVVLDQTQEICVSPTIDTVLRPTRRRLCVSEKPTSVVTN